ncbi:YicC family protein [bacterium]|nr:YicC family protein [bacterium]
MKSMTGFGSATRETPFGRMTIEMRSVNSRFLDTNLRIGATFSHLETAIRTALRNRLQRGKVDVTLRFDPSEELVPAARINKVLLKRLMADVQEAVEGGVEIRPESLLSVPGVVLTASESSIPEEADKSVLEVLDEAIDGLIQERSREGESLREVLREHHRLMSERTQEITTARAEVVQKYREKLLQRIEELMNSQGGTVDPGRLEQEVVFFADKADITEECDRLAAHLEQLKALVDKDEESVGRSLEFLAQEILREINTIGSKCRDLEIARAVLDLKQQVESCREQLANVE